MTYHDLKSYQQALIIHDFTVGFCKQYLNKFSRTVDQMEQAARSGKQNIAEGCSVSQTSPSTELKLLGVARASLEELLEDYKDFLRQRSLKIWDKGDQRAVVVRQLVYKLDKTDKSDKSYKSDRTDKTDRSDKLDKTYRDYEKYLTEPESAANVMIVLINQTNYLLDQQLKAIRQQLEDKGISLVSQQQKSKMVLAEKEKGEREFDEYLQKFLKKKSDGSYEAKNKSNKSDKSDRSDKTDKSNKTDKSDKSDKSDRSDRSNKSDKTDKTDRSDRSDETD